MNNDLIVKITSEANNDQLSVADIMSGRRHKAKELLVLNGRVAKQPSGTVAQSKGGVFYTPILMRTKDNELCTAVSSTAFFKSDGKTPVNLNYHKLNDLREVVMPTLICNGSANEVSFYSLIGYGPVALELSKIPRGSKVFVVGEPYDYKVGDFNISALKVMEIQMIRKGTTDEIRQN